MDVYRRFLFSHKKEILMKTKQTLVCGLLAVIFALAFTACDDGNGNGNSGGGGGGGEGLSITGLPSGIYAVRIFPGGTDISTTAAVVAASNKQVANGNNAGSGNVFTLQTHDTDPKIWTGSGNFPVLLIKGTSQSYATVSFSNGIGTAQYSSFADCAVGSGLTIIGLPSDDYMASIFPVGTDISTLAGYNAAINENKEVARGHNQSGGNVFTLQTLDTDSKIWTGSGDFPVHLVPQSMTPPYNPMVQATVSFSNGIGTAQYSSFKGKTP
jgi:hypothetical protein